MNEVLLAGENPDYFIEIDEAAFNTKIEALQEHVSQIGQAPIKELRKRLRARMREVGKKPGYKMAEGFKRMIWG